MPELLSRLFNNISIRRKFLLASAIPLLALLLLSLITYQSVQTFSDDEEQLNSLYLAQKTAAQYMRLVVDLETGFRGFVLTEQDRYLRPYRIAQEGIAAIGRDLEDRVSGELLEQFRGIQSLVTQLSREKDQLIQAVRRGERKKALQYIEEGRGRELMAEIRRRMVAFDQIEQQRATDELAQLSQDRASTLFVILGGGVLTFGLMVGILYLIAQSIAAPLVTLAKTVESSPVGLVPTIAVPDRQDEIGYLARVMYQMGRQIRDHVSELEKSEATLRQLNAHLIGSEAKYRGLVDHAPFGIFTTTGTQVTFSNRYNQVLAGLDPDEAMDPATFRQRIHPEDQERVLVGFEQAVRAAQPHETVFRFLLGDGSTRKILSRRLPIKDGDRQPPLYVAFNVDITALDDLQSRLSRSEKLATLGQVAAGIAHELRNPLVGIGSTASLLLDEFTAADPRLTDIQTILTETKRLDRIVNQIVDYARPRVLVPVRFAVQDLVEEVVKSLKAALSAKQLSVTCSLSPTLSSLQADRDQLKQVLLNIVHNAVDASPAGGSSVDVTAYEFVRNERAGVILKVTDGGIGIGAEALPHVFEPFFTTGKAHGTGLGLAICRNIIDSHGGEITLTSEVGQGTTVRIWLPLSQE